MSQILITGAAGLLGSHFARHLLSKGFAVAGIDNLSGGYREFLPVGENFTFFEGDLEDLSFVKRVFSLAQPTVVYHFAAYAAEGLSPFIRKFNYMNNLVSTANVVTASIAADAKLVFASSMAVYGRQAPPFLESMKPEPIDPYGIAKFAAEQDIAAAGEQFGLRWTIVRPHNVLGIYQNIWDRYRNVIGIFIRRTLNDEPMIIYGDGLQKRAFSDIRYYLQPFELLMEDRFNGEVFNIGADKYFTLNEVSELVADIAISRGFSPKVEFAEARHEVKDAFCDHSKAKAILGFQDGTDLRQLITDMFDWAQEQPNRQVKNMEYELDKGLYSYWA